jgi:hypothetical protein
MPGRYAEVKPIRNTALTVAAITLLAAPLVGCGVENTMGPIAERPTAPAEASRDASFQSDGSGQFVVGDPGSVDDPSLIDGEATGSPTVSGTGGGRPNKPNKPKKPKNPRYSGPAPVVAPPVDL